MKTNSTVVVILGFFLYISGCFINLFFSSNLLWGEMEARLYTPQTAQRALDISCPLMIAPWETATISTVVTNILATQETKPQVNAFISHGVDARVVSETLLLEPFESQAMQWTVDSSDIIFERLILVSILQRPYRNLPAHQGTCSIFVYSLFGMSGKNTLILIVEVGVLATLLGAGILFYRFRPFNNFSKKLLQSNILFLVLVFAGLISSLNRLWGLTLFFNATALLVITVGTVEILFGSKK
jgi:hypothetical protein